MCQGERRKGAPGLRHDTGGSERARMRGERGAEARRLEHKQHMHRVLDQGLRDDIKTQITVCLQLKKKKKNEYKRNLNQFDLVKRYHGHL